MLHIWPVAVPQLYLQCKLSQGRKYKVWQDQHECITTTHLFYIKQWHPVSQGLPGACGCNGNDILAIQYSPNYTNLPETCTYTKGFKDLSLGFFIAIRH